MAKALYDGVNGIARKVTKKYDGVDGVARNVKKAYEGVNGVARQYFMSGVTWKKFSCAVTDAHYTKKTVNSTAISDIATANNVTSTIVWNSYNFSEANGFTCDSSQLTTIYPETADEAVGMYTRKLSGKNHLMYEITSCVFTEKSSGVYSVTTSGRMVARANYTAESYGKGSTSYGEISVSEGELPEDGTLIEGSADGDYCVLKVGSTYYYYVKN